MEIKLNQNKTINISPSVIGAAVIVFFSISAYATEGLTKKQITAIQDAVREELKDPESAKFRKLKATDGNSFCGQVNAKNSYGGYTGFRTFTGVMMNKPYIFGFGTEEESLATAQVCKDQGYL